MKESTEVVIFDYEKMPAYAGAKEKQESLVKENPFIEISDSKTYQLAKKHRTALKTGRTELQNGEKTIASKLKDFRDSVKEKTFALICITKGFEEKQQVEINRYENQKEEEKQAAEKAEKIRIENLRNKLNILVTEKSTAIGVATNSTIDGVISDIESLDNDFEDLQEDFLEKKHSLLVEARKKGEQLAEDSRLQKEKEETKKEADRLKKEREEFEKQKKAELEKQEKEALIKKQKEEFKWSLKLLDINDFEIDQMNTSDRAKDIEASLEKSIDGNFGEDNHQVKEKYSFLKEKLSKKKEQLLISEQAAQIRKEQESKQRQELGIQRQQQLKSVNAEQTIDECLEFNESQYFKFFEIQKERFDKEKILQAKQEAEEDKKREAKKLQDEKLAAQAKKEKEEKEAIQKELQKTDFEKAADLINNLADIKNRYDFKSEAYKQCFDKAVISIDEIIHFIEEIQ